MKRYGKKETERIKEKKSAKETLSKGSIMKSRHLRHAISARLKAKKKKKK